VDTPAKASELAKTLCQILDTKPKMQAENAQEKAEDNVIALVGLLVLSGARWFPL
jgi:hypothetical protein